MNLFFTERTETAGRSGRFYLEKQEALHAVRVLRLGKGDKVAATDGKGRLFKGIIEQITKNRVVAEISEIEVYPKPVPEIVIAVGNIKKRDRLEFAVEKAVELGAGKLIVFRADHSEKKNVRLDRLVSAALEAMKQSLRCWLPEVKKMDSLQDIVQDYLGEYRVIAADENLQKSEVEIAELALEKKLLFIVGPEGGFSKEEIKLFDACNLDRISMGRYRLRTETAVIALSAAFLK